MPENVKAALYTLNADGTVPDCILDGGYHGVDSDSQPPQDYKFVGVCSGITTENKPENVIQIFNTSSELSEYLSPLVPEKNEEYYYETIEDPLTGITTEISGIKTTILSADEVVNEFWSRVESYQ